MRRTLFLLILLALMVKLAVAQQPQTQAAPIYAVNAKYVQGFGPGYWPTPGTGLTLNVAAGTAFCGGTVVTYAAGTLTLTASATNYVYLNTGASCVPAVKTTAFTSADIPVATVVAGASAITTITDDRTLFQQSASGVGMNISGLTAGYIPLAGSATTLTGNSHLDDGVTTAATITSPEPVTITNAISAKIVIEGGTTQNGIQLNSLTASGGVDGFYFFNGHYISNNGFGIFDTTSNQMGSFLNDNGHSTFFNRDTDCGAALCAGGVTTWGVFGFSTGSPATTFDGGLSRVGVGAIAVGNGTAANTSGSMQAQHFVGGGAAVTLSGTGGTPTCTVSTCLDLRGRLSVPSATTASVVTFATAYSTAPVCQVTQNGGATFFVPAWTSTTTALTITTGIALTATEEFDYSCIQ